MKNYFIILSQFKSNSNSDSHSRQLSLPLASLQKQQKPQISSIPGTSPKQRDRYRVVFGGEILSERLTIDEALKLAKGGEA